MTSAKTPGVYIVEKNSFPDSMVQVQTAVPAFIGHTAKAENRGKSLTNIPWRITSIAEYHTFFGGEPTSGFSIREKEETTSGSYDFSLGEKRFTLVHEDGIYLLYYSMLLFFSNGRGPCYIVSVGDYNTPVEQELLKEGINTLIKEQEPTLVVVPETVLLPDIGSGAAVHQAMLHHCGSEMRNRFAILDIWEGFLDRKRPEGDTIQGFRDHLISGFPDFGATYYPWLNTSIIDDKDLGFWNINNPETLKLILAGEFLAEGTAIGTAQSEALQAKLDEIGWTGTVDAEKRMLNLTLLNLSPVFKAITVLMNRKLNLLPPGAAVAGIYTMVDNSRGVWKAPANVSLNRVISPAVNISGDEQQELNVSADGKSVNAIRTFIGEGVLIWGARTLDGNSLDWRYINIRRTVIMLEESLKLALKAYVFEPNDSGTWVTIKSMIVNFLTGIWKQGGLAGATPDDAFSVSIGLGNSMTPEDVLNGILRVTVLVAVSRPAEFIEITFQQQMQKS
jgi:phage tail sheath protein FI